MNPTDKMTTQLLLDAERENSPATYIRELVFCVWACKSE